MDEGRISVAGCGSTTCLVSFDGTVCGGRESLKCLDAAAFGHSGSLLEIDNRYTRTATSAPKYQRCFTAAVAVGFGSRSRAVGFLGFPSREIGKNLMRGLGGCGQRIVGESHFRPVSSSVKRPAG